MSKLTKAEKAWIAEVQAALDKCPSDRIGFFTTGDCSVYLWDMDKADAVNARREDFCSAVSAEKAGFSVDITFPAQVESTAG